MQIDPYLINWSAFWTTTSKICSKLVCIKRRFSGQINLGQTSLKYLQEDISEMLFSNNTVKHCRLLVVVGTTGFPGMFVHCLRLGSMKTDTEMENWSQNIYQYMFSGVIPAWTQGKQDWAEGAAELPHSCIWILSHCHQEFQSWDGTLRESWIVSMGWGLWA